VRIRFVPLLALVALAAAVAVAAGGAASRPSAYILPGDNVFPEGVAYQRGTNTFFVTSTGDGSIFKGDLREETTTHFIANSTPFSSIGAKVDREGFLWVAGGPTGLVNVYSAGTGARLVTFATGSGGFLNDLVIARSGDVFVTDSFRPILYRVAKGADDIEPFLSFAGTPLVYGSGFNLNGIVATPNSRYLVVTQSNTGKLFRIEVATKEVTEIDLGESVPGDGLQLRGRTLWAVAGGAIVKVRLSDDLTRGRVVSRTVDPSFNSPTTNAIARGRMLVVNSQFAARNAGVPPVLPFTVSSIPIP